MKTYDKHLARVKYNEYLNAIVDKSVIKNGYVIKFKDKHYVKINQRLVRIDLENPIYFTDVDQEEIQMVYDTKGKALTERVEVEVNE